MIRFVVWTVALTSLAAAAPLAAGPGHQPARPPRIDDPATPTIATYGFRRQISMFYTLDLKRDNAQALSTATVFRSYEAKVRACYTKRLDETPDLRGDLVFALKISKATGAIQSLVRSGGTLADLALETCIKEQLGSLAFSPPHDLAGTLSYQFDNKQANLPTKIKPETHRRARPVIIEDNLAQDL